MLKPQKNPDEAVAAASDGRLRLILEGAVAYLRGDFEHTISCYRSVEDDDAAMICSSPLTIAAAISTGDYALYSQIEAHLKNIVAADMGGCVTACAELALDTATVSALASNIVSDWLQNGKFGALPPQTRQVAAYLRAKCYQGYGQYEQMLLVAQTALGVCDTGQGVLFAGIYFRVACAIACFYLERIDEAKEYLLDAMSIALPHGFITPLAKSAAAFGGLLERCLEQEFPEHYDAVIGLWKRIFANWVTFHNQFTKNNITHILSLRDYQIALLLTQRASYKTIARQLNISTGRLSNIIQEIYGRLFVHSRDELAHYILPGK